MGDIILHPAFNSSRVKQLIQDRDYLVGELGSLAEALDPWLPRLSEERGLVLMVTIDDVRDWLDKLDFSQARDTIGATQLSLQLTELQQSLQTLLAEVVKCIREVRGPGLSRD